MNIFDIIYIGDFGVRHDGLRRIAEEALLNAELGYRTGLVHLASTDEESAGIDPGIQELIDTETALSLEYSETSECRLAIVIDPSTAFERRPKLPVRICAEQVLAIADRLMSADAVARKHVRLIQYLGETISWTATTYDVLAQARAANVPTLGTIWQAFGAIKPTPSRYVWTTGSRAIVGAAVGEGTEHWPNKLEALRTIWDSDRYRVRVIGTPPKVDETRAWEVGASDQRPHVRFAGALGAFLYYPDARPADLPLTAIGACLAAGIAVFLPPHLSAVLGKGPNYVGARELPEALHVELTENARPSTAKFSAVEAHRRRMRFWLGGAAKSHRRRKARRVLFFPSNGDGLGHVTRLLAVARKLPENVTPIFATVSQAVGVIEDAGYHAEMIVSHRYANLDERAAYPWMAKELAGIMARHTPDVFVFDGNNPYGFVTEVTAARRATACLWLRRGMWQKDQDNAGVLAKERFFDAIIEPSDLAGDRDQGATAARREGVVVTEPIRLLDDNEQLSRDEARAELGLDSDRTIVLVQLGVGNQRDLAITANRVVSALAAWPDIQVVNLHPPISRHPLRHLDGVKEIAIYPLARYLRAFDFAVSAAGYNSFHELLVGGIPTVFVVTMRPELDDQLGRAAFAEASGCGFSLPHDNLAALPSTLARIVDPHARDLMRRNCERLGSANGARQAADLIVEFAR